MEIKIFNKSVVPDRVVLLKNDFGGKSLVFTLNSVNDGISIDSLSGYLEIERDDGSGDRFLLTKTVSETAVYFTLPVSRELTAVEDLLSCQVSLESQDKRLIYKTNVFYIEVKYSVDGDADFEQVVPSVITQLEEQMVKAVEDCNQIKDAFDFDKEEFLTTFEAFKGNVNEAVEEFKDEIESEIANLQPKQDEGFLTEDKTVVGAINELFSGLQQSIDGIKTFPSNNQGIYNNLDLDNGIYYVKEFTNLQYKDPNPNNTADTSHLLPLYKGSFLIKSIRANETHCFTILNYTEMNILCGYTRFDAESNKTVGFYKLLNPNITAQTNTANTFTQIQKISATIPENDNSTNIPTTAWVQNELANISGGTKLYKHICTLVGNGYWYDEYAEGITIKITAINNDSNEIFTPYFQNSLENELQYLDFSILNPLGSVYADFGGKKVLLEPVSIEDNSIYYLQEWGGSTVDNIETFTLISVSEIVEEL